MKSSTDAERRVRELAASLPKPASTALQIPPRTASGELSADDRGVMPAVRSVGGTLKRAVKTFSLIFASLGAVSLANALSLDVVNRLFGLVPRTIAGMPGILFHPLLHANFSHLAMNSLGILTLGGVVFLRNQRDFWRVTAFATLFAGSVTWLVGRDALHVGASGVVFGYLGYLLTTGWFDRKPGAILLSLSAAAIWGSALLGLSPLQQGVSWELHVFGLIAGAIVASWRRKRTPK